MPNKIFISYAGNDPAWPERTVRELATEFENLGALVLLDKFHLERQAVPGKLSPSEWRTWMRTGLQEADRVLCLVSERYAQAVERNLGEAWGCGVAHESQTLIAELYSNKGHNDKRILTVRPDGAPIDHIPKEFRQACPEYQWPNERVAVLEHGLGRRFADRGEGPSRLPGSTTDGDASPTALPESTSSQDHQARHAIAKLSDQAAFFRAVVGVHDGQIRNVAPPAALTTPHTFVAWLSDATQDEAQAVMWDVRTALERQKQFTGDREAQAAAVAVYMLCAQRWVVKSNTMQAGDVLSVPELDANVLAVLSAAYFGGRVEFASQAGRWVAHHVYDLRAATGHNPSDNLLRTMFAVLFADDMEALDIIRRDDEISGIDDLDESEEAKERRRKFRNKLIGGITSRLNDIRIRQRLSFTLVIDRPEAFRSSDWASELNLSPFFVDQSISEALFLVKPDVLEAEIRLLLRLMRSPSEGAAPS